ncbi:MAG: hypothetical protein JWR01_1666 [Subtercola sp.]|nr:hypothetical protein [Subtercola sp.]
MSSSTTHSSELSVEDAGAEVRALLGGAPQGDPLDEPTARLLELAVRACGTTLDLVGTGEHLAAALDAGVTGEQVQELLVLVAGIGMHALIATSTLVADELRRRGHPSMTGEFDERQAEVWSRIGGGDEREARIAAVAPDFLPNLVRLSPEQTVVGVVDFRAAPWVGTTLSLLQKELIGIAVDTMPSHRFLPTLRIHAVRARELGAGRTMIDQVLAISAAAPSHAGVR